ncbi:MAG: hypothetical protein ACLFQK_10520 [Fibrobacterota bacterium]
MRIICILCLVAIPLLAQTSGNRLAITYADYGIPPRKLIDSHTAGLLPRAYYDVEMKAIPGGGLIFGMSVGIWDRFSISLSFGGDNIIGEGDVEFQKFPGVLVKYRLIEENYFLPALALGFDNQGSGKWDAESGRYRYKSKGFFAAISKSYLLLNYPIGFHGGANYNSGAEVYWTEEYPEDEATPWNFNIGIDKSINEEIALVTEYDFAVNDNPEVGAFFCGYLNAGVRWTLSQIFTIEIDFKDLIGNSGNGAGNWSRELRLVYLESF